MAPWVSSGAMARAMLALLSISCMDDADEPREAAAAVGLVERHRAPAGVGVGLVGLLEARRA